MSRSFGALVGAQFFGAFNDNLFKQLILLLAAGTLFPGKDLQGVAFAVFSLPFVLFSGVAGDLSERYSKRRIVVQMKVAEIGIMAAGILAFFEMSWTLMLVVLAIMGTQSAFFGPSKYGVIPEIVPPDRLVPANGMITMTTFLAVLTGQALAGPLMDAFGPAAEAPRLWMPGVVCVGFAVLGTVIALGMRPLPALRPELKIGYSPFGDLPATLRTLRKDRRLFDVLLLNSFLWFNSAVLNQAVNGLGGRDYLAVPADAKVELSYLLTTISVGIIAGSLAAPRLAARFSLGRVVFLGAGGMAALQIGLLLIGPVVGRDTGGFPVALSLLFAIGFAGALAIVSVQSWLQDAPPAGMRGQTFAANNFLNFLFMFFAGGFYLLSNLVGPTFTQLGGAAILVVYLVRIRRSVAPMAIGGAG
ncbi:MAG: MFS transporter [Myxococcales bacterium]|nr:MFS transporter [Myxococcales bacterium]